jgi:hypothetical protein
VGHVLHDDVEVLDRHVKIAGLQVQHPLLPVRPRVPHRPQLRANGGQGNGWRG